MRPEQKDINCKPHSGCQHARGQREAASSSCSAHLKMRTRNSFGWPRAIQSANARFPKDWSNFQFHWFGTWITKENTSRNSTAASQLESRKSPGRSLRIHRVCRCIFADRCWCTCTRERGESENTALESAARRYAAGAGIGRSPTRVAPAARKFRHKRPAQLLSPTRLCTFKLLRAVTLTYFASPSNVLNCWRARAWVL